MTPLAISLIGACGGLIAAVCLLSLLIYSAGQSLAASDEALADSNESLRMARNRLISAKLSLDCCGCVHACNDEETVTTEPAVGKRPS